MATLARGSLAAVVTTLLCAQAQVITTVVGTDFTFPPTPIAAINAPAGYIVSVAVDAGGNLYASDTILGNNLVFKVNPQGVLTVVAGNGILGFSGDGGAATGASLGSPAGIAVDSAGNLFIVDDFNERIRKVTREGIISTVAGNGTQGYSGDGGPAINAAFNFVAMQGGVAVDAFGDLFIADAGNDRIREITPDGVINTVAGNGTQGYSGDGGPAISAELSLSSVLASYESVALDAAGNLYIADAGNNVIRKVTHGGIISTVAGNGMAAYSGDGGPAVQAALFDPSGVAVDASGNLFIAAGNSRIRKVTPEGIISTVAGNGTPGYSGDGGPAVQAALDDPLGVTVDASGNIFVADNGNERIRKVTSAGIISTVAGNGLFRFAGDGGPATSAVLYFPSGVASDLSGNLYVADTSNNRIRKVTPGGIISTVAGNGTPGYSGDGGPATQAGLVLPLDVAVDTSGDLFIADTGNHRVRKVTPEGTISTVAGNGVGFGYLGLGYSGEGGLAIKASLGPPTGVATDGSGDLFIVDYFNNAIRKVTPGGIISTVAGNGMQGYSGDDGPALQAALNSPNGVVVDASSNLFIVDSGNDRIRKVTPGGIISTVTGNGIQGYSGDGGPATSASLALSASSQIDGVAVDGAGNLYIADSGNAVIRMVTPGGMISTVAGNGMVGNSGDGGPAVQAAFINPLGVAVDSTGNLFISDQDSSRIREVLVSRPVVSVSPQQIQFSAASNGAPTTPQTLIVTSPLDGIAFLCTTDANWLRLNPTSGVSPRLIQVTADPTGLAPQIYHATINIGTPNATPAYTLVSITFTVTAALPPALSIDKASLSFPFPQQGSARSQTITVTNTGGGTLPFTVMPTTNTGGNWLSVSPSSGQALPGSPLTLTVTANPSGLAPGAYSGQVTVTAGAQSQSVAVTMTISTLNQAILLSQSGLSLLAVQAGGVVPSQSFAVQNIGVGIVNWSASTTTVTGGDWLQTTPSSGSSDASAETSPRVTVSVNASMLSAGVYYGLVRVDAPGAANTPQVVTVFLQVLPPYAQVAGVVQPAQLLFTATAGAESPGSQTIQVFNIVSQAKSFQSQVSADMGLSLATLPQDATLDPQQPTSIVVQPITTALSAGVYSGTVTLQFSDGTVSAVQVSVIVSNARGTSASARSRKAGPADSTPCTPSKLVPALTTLGQTFTVSAGWPAALVVNVKDDCGMSMQPTGSVTVSFSNGDALLSLQSQGGGSWESTWLTGNATPGLTLTVNAAYQSLTGNAVVNGSLASQQQPPVFPSSGIVSAATAVSFTALAPGSAISIYGNMLAESAASAQTLPLPSQLLNTDTQVFVSGTTAAGTSTGLLNVPLYYVSPNQVNALIPYEVSVDTSLQLLVQRGPTLSVPIAINTAQAQPAIFSTTGEPGGAGLIQVFPARGGAPYLASASAPAHMGDTIVAYCAGLGAVNPAVTDGAAPGEQLSSTTSTAQLMIGGQSAPVSFSGLTPGFAGLYQVNAVVPPGVQTGSSVLVTMSIAGQTSPAVTIAIQ